MGLEKRTRLVPFRGIGIVLRQQMRRARGRDLIGAIALLLILLGVSALLESDAANPRLHPALEGQAYFWQGTAFYLYSVRNFVLRWLMMYASCACAALLPLAGILGARGVPAEAETSSIQEMLLTRLRMWDICVGYWLASLFPLLAVLAGSGLFWLVCAFVKSAPGSDLALGQIVAAHLVLVCGVGMMGALGFLFAGRREPGGLWGRGAFAATTLAALCLGGILLINPLVQRMENPVPLINTTLLVNPAAGVASALKVDVLRLNWLYERTDAHDYPFSYPAPLAACLLFMTVALCNMGIAAYRMRRAYLAQA